MLGVALLGLLMVRRPLPACGPFFPNNLLDQGDQALLAAPVTDFVAELERMNLAPSKFQTVPAEETLGAARYGAQAAAAESADLSLALKQAKVSEAELERIRKAHQDARDKLQEFRSELDNWEHDTHWVQDENGGHPEKTNRPQPTFPQISIPEGLPAEFADYLEGALAWRNPALTDKAAARTAWQRLLDRPADERHFKSAWAAFMLGKLFEKEDPDKAIAYFKQVRGLARQGFADSVGLAAACLGLEARIYYQQEKFEPALELYLEQLDAGDRTAPTSLHLLLLAVLGKGTEALSPLASNPRTQRVVTAFLVSHPGPTWNPIAERRQRERALVWLQTVEAVGVKDVDSAEKLALIAYQHNEIDLAERWLRRAPHQPLSQWLQAKLLLRAGKVAEASATLTRVVPLFPIEPPSTNHLGTESLQHNLLFPDPDAGDISAARHVLGEMGTLHLARNEYVEALDALLNAGFWMDAAYVAERVLTTDELKEYVDRSWPAVPAQQVAEEQARFGESPCSPALLRESIRYLLGRRLTRTLRGDEAREYYPAEWQPAFEVLAQYLRVGWDEAQPPIQRARALFAAARLTRTNGLELVGTEVEPDWRIHGGNFEEGVSVNTRPTNDAANIVVASQDELRRAAQHRADPEERFHYRYQAASLAWEAAKLLPDDSDETALVLWTGGTWIKGRDLDLADMFYKTLVRRNRKTELGAEADRRHWFPPLDQNGRFVPVRPPRLQSVGPPAAMPEDDIVPVAGWRPAEDEFPIPGRGYNLHTGDTIQDIARAASKLGTAVTVQDILRANPGLNQGRLQVGQRIWIPAKPTSESPSPAAPSDPQLTEIASQAHSLQPPTEQPSAGSASATFDGDQESTRVPPNPEYLYQYEIQSGDTLAQIARDLTKAGNPVTWQEILGVNPGLEPTRIQAGQKILIPR
jgi:LysM repeat protein